MYKESHLALHVLYRRTHSVRIELFSKLDFFLVIQFHVDLCYPSSSCSIESLALPSNVIPFHPVQYTRKRFWFWSQFLRSLDAMFYHPKNNLDPLHQTTQKLRVINFDCSAFSDQWVCKSRHANLAMSHTGGGGCFSSAVLGIGVQPHVDIGNYE